MAEPVYRKNILKKEVAEHVYCLKKVKQDGRTCI